MSSDTRDLILLARFCERKGREYSNKLLNVRLYPTSKVLDACVSEKYTKLRKLYKTEAARIRKELKHANLNPR